MAITTVHNELIAENAISGTLIADNAITATHIATNAVSGVIVADNAITTVHIAENNVTSTSIVANAITSTQLADNAVIANKIPDGILTNTHLNSAVISSQSAVTAVSGDYVLIGDTSDSNALKKALVSDLGTSNLDGLSDAKSGGANFTSSLIIGHQTTGTLSSAHYNTAVGYGAMDAITQGDENVAVGYGALGDRYLINENSLFMNFFKKKISKIVNINIGINVPRNKTLIPIPKPIAKPTRVEKYFLLILICCV